MRSFAEDKAVHDSFKSAALKMPNSFVSSGLSDICLLRFYTVHVTDLNIGSIDSNHTSTNHQCSDSAVIPLVSRNPVDYRNDVLAKLMVTILNPLGIWQY